MTLNNSSVAAMATQNCTNCMVERWGCIILRKKWTEARVRGHERSRIASNIESFGYISVADIMGLVSVSLTYSWLRKLTLWEK